MKTKTCLFKQAQGRRLLSLERVSEITDIPLKTLYNRSGRKAANPLPFPLKRIGRRVYVNRSDLERFIDEL